MGEKQAATMGAASRNRVPGPRRISPLLLGVALAGAAVLLGCAAEAPTYPGLGAYFSKQFQAVQFTPDRPKDKYETSAQYDAWCAKRIADNAELVAARARALTGSVFVAAVPAEVGEYDADAAAWTVNATVQEGSAGSEASSSGERSAPPTLDDRYWCGIVLANASGEPSGVVKSERKDPQGDVRLESRGGNSDSPRRYQRLTATIPAPPEKAREMAEGVPERQPCELWLHVEVLGVDVLSNQAPRDAGKSFTPTEADLRCAPRVRISRVELRRKSGSLAYVWDLGGSPR